MSRKQRMSLLVLAVFFCLLQETASAQQEPKSKVPTVELQPKHILNVHVSPASLRFSADGKRFAAADFDGQAVRVWDTRTWKQVARLSEGGGPAVLSPDGRTIAFAETDIRILDVESGKLVQTLSGHRRPIESARFSPDGKTIASAAEDGLKLWDVKSGKDLSRFSVEFRDFGGILVDFSPDGTVLAVAAPDGTVHLLNTGSGKELHRIAPPPDDHPTTRSGLAFSPDGRFLAVGLKASNLVTVWDVKAGKPAWQLGWPKSMKRNSPGEEDQKRPAGVQDLAFTADSRCLIGACSDRRLRMWEVATGGLRFQAEEPVVFLASSRQSPLLANASRRDEAEERIFIWDSTTCVPLRRPTAPPNLEDAWSSLDAGDAAVAFGAMREMICDPRGTVGVLENRLSPVLPVKEADLDKLVRELDDERFEVREKAKVRLGEVGHAAKAVLTRALANSPSAEARKQIKELLDDLDAPPRGERLRVLRAVEVLETVRSSEATRLLKHLAGGDPNALLIREAKSALERIQRN